MALPSRNIQTGEFGVDTLALLTLAPRPHPPSPRRPSRSIDPQFRRPKSIRSLGTATAHLRDVLGDQTYESLARKGETMTNAEMVAYAYDQIDQARAELNAVSE